MGRLDNQPDHIESEDPKETEQLLRSMTRELRNLQEDLVTQLHQDIRRLQTEKSRLINDVEKLQNQYQTLQSQCEITLSRQQLEQQQTWAKQLALALANHLHNALSQRLSQTLSTYQIPPRTVDVPQLSTTSVDAESTYRLLASIDETINRTFTSLHHDLNSYQSAVSQQIGRMHDLGQQGEAILEVLVGRISQQLQTEMLKGRENQVDRPEAPPPPANFSPANFPPGNFVAAPPANAPLRPPYPNPPVGASPNPPYPPPTVGSPSGVPAGVPPASTYSEDAPIAPVPPSAPSPTAPLPSAPIPAEELELSPSSRATPARQSSPFRLGVVLILFSTLTLALHHVVVQIISTQGNLFGNSSLIVGGYINLNMFSTALLLLWVRMIAIVPLMAWLSGVLYPAVWRDVRSLFAAKDRRILWSLVGSGIFLLLSQVFLYIAIGTTTPAIAVTLSSVYPLAIMPLSWLLFGDRPTRLRVVAMLILVAGLGFTLFAAAITPSSEGIVAALISGTTLALYLVAMMIINRRKINPVPISLVQNATAFVLSSLFLIGVGTKTAPTNWPGLIAGGLILGGLTIVSYALNDFGSRILGAARATIIASSVPILTALLAFVILPAANSLSLGQIIGILLVTMGTAALSFDRILSQYKTTRRAKPQA